MRYRSWGGTPSAHQTVIPLFWARENLPEIQNYPALPFGNGRSYGDVCINNGGTLLETRKLDRFVDFNFQDGEVTCEGGVLLAEILNLIVPQGWFLPVTPGTRFVTVGGAIANDVHGKNHHRAGTFGCHVREFEILRSDGTRTVCSPSQNSGLFSATIGGLGLTGVILWARISLRRIANPFIQSESVPFFNIDHFFRLSEESDRDYEYTVAWIDCLGKGKSLGRGIFFRGNHSAPLFPPPSPPSKNKIAIPFDIPVSLVNPLTLRMFNELYFLKKRKPVDPSPVFYEPFFYPLDGIADWNRIYGKKGFFQYQCVLPLNVGKESIREILERITRSRNGSFLAVLKIFGNIQSPGLLSFPRKGLTLAMDFANHGKRTTDFLDTLDEVVERAGGAIYPAKDARMPGNLFKKSFPGWEKFLQYKDPLLESGFWRRVMEEKK